MSISFAASGPSSGTFLNPLPQIRSRQLAVPTVDVGGGKEEHESDVTELEQAMREERDRQLEQSKWTNMHVNVQHQFNLDVVYQTVANRRLAFDNMTWQVPIMALTAHAFLFTIALAGDSTPLSRYLSMAISLIITILTCRLFIGHMIREVADREWLSEFEKTYLPEVGHVHVKHWNFRKRVNKSKAGWMRPLFIFPAFQTWRDGLVVMGGISVAVIAVTAVRPNLFASGDADHTP